MPEDRRGWAATLCWTVIAGGVGLALLIAILIGPSHPLEVLLVWVFLPALLAVWLAMIGIVALITRSPKSNRARGRAWLSRVFWALAAGEGLLAMAAIAADLAIQTGVAASQFDAALAFILSVLLALLIEFMVVVALIRNDVGYAVGLAVLVLVLPPFYGTQVGKILAVYLTTPNAELVRSGHGFTRPADRALADAIIARNAEKVASLAPAANLNEPNWNHQTFISLALQEGAADNGVIVALLRAGADPDGKVFDFAVEHRDMRLLRDAIDAGIDLSNRGNGWNPRLFVGLDWPEALSLMLEHGANPDAEDFDGTTAIVWAVYSGHWPAIDILLAHGARTDVSLRHQTSLRDIALAKSKQLREQGSDVPPQLAAFAARFGVVE